MRVIFDALLVLGGLLVHLLLSRYAPELGRHLDLFLCLTITAGALRGRLAGLGMGVAAGLVQDQFFGIVIGMNAFSKAIIGYASGAIASRFLLEGTLWRSVVIGLATLTDRTLLVALSLLLSQNISRVTVEDWAQAVLLNAIVGTGLLRLLVGRPVEE